MISVIVCTYNRDKYIYSTLKCIAVNDLAYDEYEIIVVDNNSTDNTVSEIRRIYADYPDVNLKQITEQSQGLSFARNRGIQESSGDILVFLDDDAFTDSHYLDRLSAIMNGHPEIDAFGGKIVPTFENGTSPKWLCKWTYSWVSGLEMGNAMIPFTRNYPIGANMGFRRKVFEKCGMFNTSLGRVGKNLAGGEEKDMFNRVRNSGFGIFYIPDIPVKHIIPETRTTTDYIRRLGYGVGTSEKIRCREQGYASYIKRILIESVKWAASLTLWIGYSLTGRFCCGNMLIYFRWYVTRGLLAKSSCL